MAEQEEPISVSKLNGQIKTFLETKFRGRIRVVGEVSNLKPSSRHMYFSLKDGDSLISVVLWATYRTACPDIENGQKIIVEGYVSCYTKFGSYQLNGRSIQLLGTGDLQQEYNKIRAQYEKRGYFDPSIKKSLPEEIRRVGVLTSLEGAALQDFLYVLKKNRFYGTLYLKNCQVQGRDCPKTVSAGLELFDKLELDLIVVTRGGGALEDLFGFSNPLVVESIFHTKTPVISAIGHEVDTMLSDLVADVRAPTPSIAGEIIGVSQRERMESIIQNKIMKNTYVRIIRQLNKYQQEMSQIDKKMIPPQETLTKYRHQIDRCCSISETMVKNRLRDNLTECDHLEKRVKLAHPQQMLDRGYCLLIDEFGNCINTMEEFNFSKSFAQKLKVQLKDGYLILDTGLLKESSSKS